MRRKLSLAAFCLALAACTTAPVTGRQQFIIGGLVTPQQGLQAYQQILSEKGESRDPELNRRVDAVGARIAQVVGDGGNWQFRVINDDTPNAFALPGGYVGVNTGLFKVVQDEAMLAAVVGHEIGHVIAHHPEERATRLMATQTGLQLGTAAMGTSAGTTQLLAQAATLGLVLPFSRTQESEADSIGLEIMARAGYDPRAAVAVWENFQRMGNQGAEFLSTHPSPGNRIANIERQLPRVMQIYEANRR